MSDEEFEKFLQREAKAYNEPPVNVPRDEMYAAISAARRSKIEDRRSTMRDRPRPYVAWIGMAATLVIGVAIGKYAFTRHDVPGAAVASKANDSARVAAQQGESSGGTYAAATTAQLVRAEALLSAYSASGTDVRMDKQLSTWARDVLTNTRLLLDSPAASDPARRRLLEDLELVLVQMVQRSPDAGAGEERGHIERSIERNQVLSRLRSALPAGRNSGI